MGARTIRRRDEATGRKRERLTFWGITAAIVLPMILAIALVAMDMRADLSELKPASGMDDHGAVPVGWPDLRERGEMSVRARLIGYMMDENPSLRDGTSVNSFVLLPEAGQFLHPAHRVPNQSVVVWATKPVVFRYRQLVWASGTLNRTLRRSGDADPAYALISAEVTPATENDIRKWFRP